MPWRGQISSLRSGPDRASWADRAGCRWTSPRQLAARRARSSPHLRGAYGAPGPVQGGLGSCRTAGHDAFASLCLSGSSRRVSRAAFSLTPPSLLLPVSPFVSLPQPTPFFLAPHASFPLLLTPFDASSLACHAFSAERRGAGDGAAHQDDGPVGAAAARRRQEGGVCGGREGGGLVRLEAARMRGQSEESLSEPLRAPFK